MENKIICINLRRFENFESFNSWIKKSENNRYIKTLKQLKLKDSMLKNNFNIFKSIDKIWIFDDTIVFFKEVGKDVMIKTDFIADAFIKNSTKLSRYKIELTVDSILDKISKSGIDSLTEIEKIFLKNVD